MCLRICAGFKGVSSRETRLWEHFGQTDKIALITCLKFLNVPGASLISAGTEWSRSYRRWISVPIGTLLPLYFCTLRLLWNNFGTHRIGANPEKSDLVNFRGPDWRKFSELCVLLFFLGKSTTCSHNLGLVNEFSQTALIITFQIWKPLNHVTIKTANPWKFQRGTTFWNWILQKEQEFRNDNKISDNKMCKLVQILLSWNSPRKAAFWDKVPSYLPPPRPPPKPIFC